MSGIMNNWRLEDLDTEYKFLKFFMISVILFKMGKHGDFRPSFFQIVSAWRDFTVVKKTDEKF